MTSRLKYPVMPRVPLYYMTSGAVWCQTWGARSLKWKITTYQLVEHEIIEMQYQQFEEIWLQFLTVI